MRRRPVLVAFLSLAGASASAAPASGSLPVIRQFRSFGPHVTLGQVKSEYINVKTTFIPGRPPAQVAGNLFLWSGLSDQENKANGDLIQTAAEYHVPISMQLWCNAQPGQWCIRPHVVSRGYISQSPVSGVAIDATDKISIEYSKASGPNGMWNQTLHNVSKGNKWLFSYVRGTSKCKWFEMATETQGGNEGSADVQYYFNTTLTLLEPEPSLSKTLSMSKGIQMTDLTTRDGGKTWFIEMVAIPAMQPGKAWKTVP